MNKNSFVQNPVVHKSNLIGSDVPVGMHYQTDYNGTTFIHPVVLQHHGTSRALVLCFGRTSEGIGFLVGQGMVYRL